MDNKLILVNLITLLFRERELEGAGTDSSTIASEVIATVKLAETTTEVDMGHDTVIALKNTAQWLLESSIKTAIKREDLLQRIRVNVADETYLLEAVSHGIAELPNSTDVEDACHRAATDLKVTLNKERLKGAVKKLYLDTHYSDGEVEWDKLPGRIMGEMEEFSSAMTGREVHDEMVTEIDISDTAALTTALQKARASNTSEGVLKLGWRGWNKMFGVVDGFRRGDEVCIGALQHNFKSGTLLHIARQIATYNVPYMLNPNKKPLIVHFTLENSAEDNMMILYKWFKEDETGEEFDVRDPDLNLGEAAEYVQKKLSVNGYHFKFLRFNPSDFTHEKFAKLIRDYEKEYEIHLISLDYANLMSKEGCTGGTDSAIIRDLFRRLRNHTNPRGITLLTAHQLSSDAKYLLRVGCDNFVKEIANRGYWADCKQIDQELDIEIIIHLERPGDGTTYLTACRGKHRCPFVTPEKDLYTVYKFRRVGGLPDDYNKDSVALNKVGMGSIGSEDGLWD